jgi:nucleotide-binding universal stress UspA family protein
MRALLAVDGSKCSEAAARALAAQMRSEGAEILVLEVVEPRIFSTPPQMLAGYAPEQDEILKEQFKQAHESVNRTSQVLRSAGFNVDTRVAEGEVRTGILDVAAEWHADLIVLGSHGRQGLERFLLGSVADSIVRNAHCSVLVVRIPAKS